MKVEAKVGQDTSGTCLGNQKQVNSILFGKRQRAVLEGIVLEGLHIEVSPFRRL